MSPSSPGGYMPTDGLTYDPNDAHYWDEAALAKEVHRAFDICHGCRMCFKYCDSFPKLFKFVDDAGEDDVTKLSRDQVDAVMDDCFQCKLCDVQCPYTPRENHDFQLDFPKLVHRYKAVRTRKTKLPLRDRVLGDPDGAARLARASLGIANVMNRVSAHRWFMEKTLGIHRDKKLPPFAQTTFSAWAEREGLIQSAPGGEAVLFQTCYVENNEPDIGRDTVEVLQRNQVDVRCSKGLNCCGMPAWESGDLDGLRAQARRNLDRLEPFVDAGAKVVVVNPTCSMMLRREYPELVAEADRERAKKVAAATRDAGEFVWDLRKEDRFNEDFKTVPESIAYHAPCHLRAQSVGFRGRDLLRKAGVKKLGFVAECCGHDGTYGMKVETFEASKRIGRKAFDGMKAPEAQVWATECPLAATQFEQHAGKKALHPMTILARAYRGDPLPGQTSTFQEKENDREES